MDDYRRLLPRAVEMAARAHGDAINEDGTPYILHPLRLMMRADEEGYGDAEKIVAVLHDTLEDTALTAQDLADAGFPPEVLRALGAVTKRAGEDYEAFIERIALDPLAARVKRLDLRDNMDVTRLPALGERALARTARYHRALRRLEQCV